IETSPAISLLKTNIYWLDFVGVVNATRYKLDVIHTQILQQEKQVLGNPLFKCSKCQKTYSDLDIVNIFDKTLNVFKCTICFNILDEWDAKSPENETTQQDNQIEDQRFAAQISLTQLFNGQMQQLYDWLKLCDEQSIYTTLNKI
ncbi:MAG: General transcription factor IIE subunit 1, partial [Marteilia pararefringens]